MFCGVEKLRYHMSTSKLNILDFDRKRLADFFAKMGEKGFRSDQVIKWVHQLGITDFSVMTNLSLSLRAYLQENFELRLPKVINELISSDGTLKWLLELEDKKVIEMVFIPEDDRGTLCISSQVGCALGCVFCATGKLGFTRNLELSEIVGQLYLARQSLGFEKHAITNVVFMGMGEPLLNLENVISAANLFLDDFAYGLSKYRVTVSTSGIVPAFKILRESSDVSFAVSLHAANDELRTALMPINKKYPLRELIPACKEYFSSSRRRLVTMEYVMLAGVNDSPAQARELVKLLRNVPCKVNLIPFNSGKVPEGEFQATKQENIDVFRNILLAADINTITRKSRGADILAACGQLAGSYKL